MILTYPSFLFALLALVIPIAIHLFNLRKYKKYYFTNVRFLKEVKNETKSKSKLKHLLLLLSRLIVISSLVFAFSLPYLPNFSNENAAMSSAEAVSIYVDNSFSMSAGNGKLTLLEKAKTKAVEISKAYGRGASIQLLTNEFDGTQQYFQDASLLQNQINSIGEAPEFRPLSAIFNRQKDLLNSTPANKTVFILSDFQKNNFDYHQWQNDSSIIVNLIPIRSTQMDNLFIDSCWFESPVRKYNEKEVLHVRIHNYSNQDYENLPVKLYLNGQQKTPVTASVKASSTATIQIAYTTREYGIQEGAVTLRDHPVVFDDAFFFNYTLDSTLSILCINGETESQALNALFKSDTHFKLTNQNSSSIDFGSFDAQQLIVLNRLSSPSSGLLQELKKFLQNKGDVLIIPPQSPDKAAYQLLAHELNLPLLSRLDTTKTIISSFNTDAPLYQGVFNKLPKNLNFPVVLKHYQFAQNQRKNAEVLLELKNGRAFLQRIPNQSGSVYLFSSPLDDQFNAFSSHSLVVPTLFNMALLSQRPKPLFYTIGENTSVSFPTTNSQEAIYHLKKKDFDVIPALRTQNGNHLLNFHQQIRTAGHYRLYNEEQQLLGGLAFNYNRLESNLTSYSTAELHDIISNMGWNNVQVVDETNKSLAALLRFGDQGEPLWKYCIILALVFLSIEMILTKIWK
jgi:hypothetical protein